MLRLVCADDPSAADHAVKLLKGAVKDFPDLFNLAKEFFPDVDFSDVAADVAAEQL